MSSKSAAARMTVEMLYCIAGKESPYGKGAYSHVRISRKLRDMKTDGYLKKGGESYSLTPRGRYRLSEEKIWALKIPKPQKWDRKWHMVLFDIPVAKGKQRNAFRARLKELGLVLYQHSVWVYPYPLEETVRQITNFYKISNCVLFAVADQLNGQNKLKQKFDL